jgi:hypothetical protein
MAEEPRAADVALGLGGVLIGIGGSVLTAAYLHGTAAKVAGATCVLVGIAMVVFASLHFRNKGRRASKAQPVSERHFTDLKATVRQVQLLVNENKQVHKNVNSNGLRALLEHNPDLARALDAWDAAMQCAQDRATRLEERMAKEAAARGITAPAFAVDVIVRGLSDATRWRVDGNLAAPASKLIWFGDKNLIMWSNGTTVIDLDKATNLTGQQATDRVQALSDAAPQWQETQSYADRDRECGWRVLKDPLLATLNSLEQRDYYRKGDGCFRCA